MEPQPIDPAVDFVVLGHESAEEALHDALARYRAVLASTLDPLVTIDVQGIIQSASDSVEKVFGWKPDELIGQNVSVLMPEPHRTLHDEYLTRYRKTGVTNILGRTREYEGCRKDGTVFPIEVSVSRVELRGNSPLFTGIIRDVTDRRRSEQELERHRRHLEELVAERTAELEASHEQLRQADRLAAIGTLAAGLGHDMNNVLLPIRCRLDALYAATLPAAVRAHFDEVRRSTEYLQQLADGLHLMALDPLDEATAAEATNLVAWWGQVGTLLSRGLPKGVNFVTEWELDLPAVLLAPHRLTQAVLNLVVNAGEAVEADGHVKLWGEAFDDRRFVRVGVTDNGRGMTPDVRRRCLDPFFTTKHRGLGTGLGLSLVRGVAKSVGGSVRIDSAPGEGTTVTIILPAATTRSARSGGIDRPPLCAVVSIRDRRMASLVSALLTSVGVDVTRDEQDDPGDADLWVTETSIASVESVDRHLADDSRRAVIVGPCDESWAAVAVFHVADPTDYEQLRNRLNQAVSTL